MLCCELGVESDGIGIITIKGVEEVGMTEYRRPKSEHLILPIA